MVAPAHPHRPLGTVLLVRAFLMSCRVLHRGVEHALARRVAEEVRPAAVHPPPRPHADSPGEKIDFGFEGTELRKRCPSVRKHAQNPNESTVYDCVVLGT